MKAAYDSFDYPSYWTDREYEHKSELIALDSFLKEIKKIDTIMDIGCGFGRLFLNYSYRAKRIILTDPSNKLLKIAKETFQKRKNIVYLNTNIQNLPSKTRRKADLAIMIRVIHHIEDADKAFSVLEKVTNKRGYLILEFANKRHAKALLANLIHRNFSFWRNTETKDRRRSKKDTLPFLNYHPEIIDNLLDKHGFDIVDKRSVSNIRIPAAKSYIPLEILLGIEKILQKPLAFFDFGPSIFVLARKRG